MASSHAEMGFDGDSGPSLDTTTTSPTIEEKVEAKRAVENDGVVSAFRENYDDTNSIVRTVRLVGGAMITILLVAVVLNEIFGAVNVGSGPFSSIGDDLETTGVAAMGLLVVGLLIVAANRLMSIFGGGGQM